MSQPAKAVESSPGKDGIGSRNQAGAPTTKLEDISSDLLADIKRAKLCDFDAFLRAFIYECLTDKSKVDEIEKEIIENETPAEGTAQSADIQGLREQRDKILEEKLQDCLRQVLPVASDDGIQKLLRAYHRSLSPPETKRYAPYVALCNKVFEKLSKLTIAGLGPALPLRCRRLDPLVFLTSSPSSPFNARRMPDGAYTESDIAEAMGALEEAPTDSKKHAYYHFFRSFLEWKDTNQKIISLGGAKLKFDTDRRTKIDYPEEALDTSSIEQKQAVPATSSPSPTLDAVSSKASGKRKLPTDDGTEERTRKRTKTSTKDAPKTESKSQKSSHGRVQCSSNALEMLSENMGLQHAINLLHLDDGLFIWYYDRQGIIRSNGINLFKDFPRFLVLMLLFQRFTPKNWGVVKAFNHPIPTPATPSPATFDLRIDDVGVFDNMHKVDDLQASLKVGFGNDDYLSWKPRCLGGRATRVLKATGNLKGSKGQVELALKISHPEVRRKHEGEVLVGIRNMAGELDKEVEEHRIENRLPELLFYGDVADTGTRLIRSLVGVETAGHRVMRVIVMKRLMPIYKLDGLQFLCAWLDAVICHAFLWKHGIEHGDPSLNNVLCDPITKRGVLTDFDLSLVQWEPRVIGTERTGTVPFMALDLLCDDYWKGLIKRQYYHELEAFIWILPFVCLDKANHPITEKAMKQWRTGKHNACYVFKTDFVRKIDIYAHAIPPSFKRCFRIAKMFTGQLRLDHLARDAQAQEAMMKPKDEDDDDSLSWDLMTGNYNSSSPDNWSQNLWTNLVSLMNGAASKSDAKDESSKLFKELVLRLKNYQPSFQQLTKEQEDNAKNAFGSAPATRPGVKLRRSDRLGAAA